MPFLKLFTISVLSVSFICNSTFAQKSKKNNQYIPTYILQFTGGASVPLMDLSGNWPSDMSKNPIPYFMRTPGFNLGINSKLFPRVSNWGVTASISLTLFSTSNLKDTTFPTGQGLFNSYSLNFLSGTIGFEYRGVSHSVIPFIGIELATNYLWGRANYKGKTLTMKGTERFGLNSGAGLDIRLNNKYGIVVGGKFSLLNLRGRNTGEFSSSGEYSIVDAPAGGSDARTMASANFYIGLSYYVHSVKVKHSKK
ncbi:MAG: hypothetical protein EHM58_17885 [Ignavibacteriae bacterium]|nr:MAG: hypothetical protein EHM58_17885 [Ignavibacteriota bacterium]